MVRPGRRPSRGNCRGETVQHPPRACPAQVSVCCARRPPWPAVCCLYTPMPVVGWGLGAWSREHGIVARMGSELLHPCRPSVKMLYCCDGAAGANGRRIGAGCGDGAGCSGGKAAGGNCCGAGDGWVRQVSSQTLYGALGCCGACKMEGSTTLGRGPS